MTPHSFDDVILRFFADEMSNSTFQEAIVMDDVYKTLKMKTKTVKELGKIYLHHCDDNGKVSYDAFIKIFHLTHGSEYSKMIFRLLSNFERKFNIIKEDKDKDKEYNTIKSTSELNNNEEDNNNPTGYILFDDFLVGVAICYQMDFIDDAITLFCRCVDTNHNNKISKNGVKKSIIFMQNFNKDIPFPCNHKIDSFCKDNFDDENEINFKKFKENVHLNGKDSYEFIQTYLQYIIFVRMGIELDKEMEIKVQK